MQMLSTTIKVPQPFDLQLTAGHQTHYQEVAGADSYVNGIYSRALFLKGRVLVASLQLEDPASATLKITVTGEMVSKSDLNYALNTITRLLGLQENLKPFYDFFEKDKILSGIIAGLRGLRPTRSENVFEALIMSIIGQQISAVVARNIRDIIVNRYGKSTSIGERTFYCFPTPESLLSAGLDGLREAKLSVRKAEYIYEVSSRVLEKSIEDSLLSAMSDDEVVDSLTKIRGIGSWTAQWVLLRALGRIDAFPAGDLALKRTIADLYFDGKVVSEATLVQFSKEHWSPYRGLATTYLFASLRQQRITQRNLRTSVRID